MKRGDKVTCKKSFGFDYPWKYFSFTKGQIYDVEEVYNKSVVINGMKFIKDNSEDSIYLDDRLIESFHNYFYTKEEEREFKLKKINENKV